MNKSKKIAILSKLQKQGKLKESDYKIKLRKWTIEATKNKKDAKKFINDLNDEDFNKLMAV